MHAISPQVMVWDPSSVGVPTQCGDMQATMLASPYPTMMQAHPYRIPEAVPQIFSGPTVHSHNETQQGLIWIPQSQLFAQEDAEAQAACSMSQGLTPGQLPVHQQGVMPVLMSINGQRVLVHQAVTQFPAYHQPGFCHVAPEAHHQLQEELHLVNVAGINQRIQQGVRIAAPMHQDPRHHMTALQEHFPGPFDRPILIPKRRNGTNLGACDTASTWRRVSDERTLGGLNTAIRRRSQSADHDANCEDVQNNTSGLPMPNKRVAPTSGLSVSGPKIQTEFWRAPDARILRKLIEIIEYYFSDDCLSKNGYMLKQLLSNGDGDGYISLRRVAALKRVKSQTRDLRTVAYAVRQSTKLEIDEEGTMIRRKRPIPENIEAPRFIRSVLAINLPNNSTSVEDVTGLFTPYGELTQVRVLRPGKTIPSYLKDYAAWVPDLGTRVCAVVEFENQDEAQKACREINMQNRGQNNLRVALLKPGARIRRTLYRIYKDENAEENAEKSNESIPKEIESKLEVATSGNAGARSLNGSSESSTNNDTSSRAANNNSVNHNKSYHYDASGSGTDTGSDSDSVGSKSEDCRASSNLQHPLESRKNCHDSGDSGFSQSSSSDERDSIIYSPTLRINSNVTKFESDVGTTSVLRRSSPIQKKLTDGVPLDRHPKGPVGDSNVIIVSCQVAS